MTTLEYLLTLTPEQAKEAVLKMSPEAQMVLVGAICGKVQEMTNHIVQNADEIWESR